MDTITFGNGLLQCKFGPVAGYVQSEAHMLKCLSDFPIESDIRSEVHIRSGASLSEVQYKCLAISCGLPMRF